MLTRLKTVTERGDHTVTRYVVTNDATGVAGVYTREVIAGHFQCANRDVHVPADSDLLPYGTVTNGCEFVAGGYCRCDGGSAPFNVDEAQCWAEAEWMAR